LTANKDGLETSAERNRHE